VPKKLTARRAASAQANERRVITSEQLAQAQMISERLFQSEGPVTPRRPPSSRYRRLIAQLGRAKLAAQEKQDNLPVALKCLVEVLHFLDDDLDVRAAALTRPLGTLAAAIRDVLMGARPPLFFDRPKEPGRPTGTSFEAVRGTIAAAVDALIVWGEPPSAAGKFVADELKHAGVKAPRGAAITSKQVLRWRHEVGGASPALTESTYKDVRAKYDSVPAFLVATTEARRNLVRGAIHGIWSMGI